VNRLPDKNEFTRSSYPLESADFHISKSAVEIENQITIYAAVCAVITRFMFGSDREFMNNQLEASVKCCFQSIRIAVECLPSNGGAQRLKIDLFSNFPFPSTHKSSLKHDDGIKKCCKKRSQPLSTPVLGNLITLLISRIILPHDEDISYSGVKRKNSFSVLCIRSKFSSESLEIGITLENSQLVRSTEYFRCNVKQT
jgi:hypothetical protein